MLENIKKKQRDKEYNKWNEKYLEGIKSKLNDTAEWISELDYRVVEITDSEQKNEWKAMKKV